MQQPRTNISTARGWSLLIFAVLALLSAMCTLFALVVTAAQAWQEHAQKSWPVVTATIDQCGTTRSSTNGRHRLAIDCTLHYSAGTEINSVRMFSPYFPAPELPQYPANQGAPYYDWIDRHPPGTPIAIRYNPAKHSKFVVDSDFYPRGGPHTHTNLVLLAFFAAVFAVSLALVRALRPAPQSTPSATDSAAPLG